MAILDVFRAPENRSGAQAQSHAALRLRDERYKDLVEKIALDTVCLREALKPRRTSSEEAYEAFIPDDAPMSPHEEFVVRVRQVWAEAKEGVDFQAEGKPSRQELAEWTLAAVAPAGLLRWPTYDSVGGPEQRQFNELVHQLAGEAFPQLLNRHAYRWRAEVGDILPGAEKLIGTFDQELAGQPDWAGLQTWHALLPRLGNAALALVDDVSQGASDAFFVAFQSDAQAQLKAARTPTEIFSALRPLVLPFDRVAETAASSGRELETGRTQAASTPRSLAGRRPATPQGVVVTGGGSVIAYQVPTVARGPAPVGDPAAAIRQAIR